MKTEKLIPLLCLLILSVASCTKEQYRTDKNNKLTKHAKKASDYLANQSIELTQSNIEKRGATEKKSRKKLERQQKELNEANARTSKVKSPVKHKGDFKFY